MIRMHAWAIPIFKDTARSCQMEDVLEQTEERQQEYHPLHVRQPAAKSVELRKSARGHRLGAGRARSLGQDDGLRNERM